MPLCASVYMCFVVTCWERADLLALVCGVLMRSKALQNAPFGLLTFITLPVGIKTFVLSIFEWSFYTGFTVYIV